SRPSLPLLRGGIKELLQLVAGDIRVITLTTRSAILTHRGDGEVSSVGLIDIKGSPRIFGNSLHVRLRSPARTACRSRHESFQAFFGRWVLIARQIKHLELFLDFPHVDLSLRDLGALQVAHHAATQYSHQTTNNG